MRALLISLATAAIASAPAIARQVSVDTEAILVAAAAHVREEIPEGRIGLEPEAFPVPSAMRAVAEAIGNTVIAPIEVRCRRGTRERCKTTPEVRARIFFKEFRLINPDSATVLIDFREYPAHPIAWDLQVIGRVHAVELVRRESGWVIAATRGTLEG